MSNFSIFQLFLSVVSRFRDVEKNNYPILLVFWPVFFVAIKLTYLDMLASSRLEYEPNSFAIWGNYFFPRPLTSATDGAHYWF